MATITTGHDSGPPRTIRRPVSRWFPYGICSDKTWGYHRREIIRSIITNTELRNAQDKQLAILEKEWGPSSKMNWLLDRPGYLGALFFLGLSGAMILGSMPASFWPGFFLIIGALLLLVLFCVLLGALFEYLFDGTTRGRFFFFFW